MEKEIIWTEQSKNDLHKIYEFNTLVLGEEESFELIEKIISKTDLLTKSISGGTRYISNKRPDTPYQKLIFKDYLIIFRTEGGIVYINKIFDCRQNPKKLKL